MARGIGARRRACADGQTLAPTLGAGIDTFALTPTAALGHLHMDPPGPVPGPATAPCSTHFDSEAVEALVLAPGEHSGSPLLSLEVRHLGGAVAHEPEHAGALGPSRHRMPSTGWA